jgi:hypothetical protein
MVSKPVRSVGDNQLRRGSDPGAWRGPTGWPIALLLSVPSTSFSSEADGDARLWVRCSNRLSESPSAIPQGDSGVGQMTF